MSSEHDTASNVFLVTVDPDDFDRTVRSTIEPGEYAERPAAIDDLDRVRLWGSQPGTQNERNWGLMASGDLLLFYAEGTFVGVGHVGTTFEDEDGWASSTFWGDTPSSLVYTVEDFREVSVPKRAVNRIFDYSASYNPPELMRVSDDRVARSPAAIERAMVLYDERNN